MTIPTFLDAVDDFVKAYKSIGTAERPEGLERAYERYTAAVEKVRKEAKTIDLVPENPK